MDECVSDEWACSEDRILSVGLSESGILRCSQSHSVKRTTSSALDIGYDEVENDNKGFLALPFKVYTMHAHGEVIICVCDGGVTRELKYSKENKYTFRKIPELSNLRCIAISHDKGAALKDTGMLCSWNYKHDNIIELVEEPILSSYGIVDISLPNKCAEEDTTLLDFNQETISDSFSQLSPGFELSSPLKKKITDDVFIITQKGEVVRQQTYINSTTCRVVVTPQQHDYVEGDAPLKLNENEIVIHVSVGKHHFCVLTSSLRGFICVDNGYRCIPWNMHGNNPQQSSYHVSPNSPPNIATVLSPWSLSPTDSDQQIDAEQKDIESYALPNTNSILEPLGVFIDGIRGYQIYFHLKKIICSGLYIAAITEYNDLWVWKVVKGNADETLCSQNFPCMNDVICCGVYNRKIVALTKEAIHTFIMTNNGVFKEHIKPMREISNLITYYRCLSLVITYNDILIHAYSRKEIENILGTPISSSVSPYPSPETDNEKFSLTPNKIIFPPAPIQAYCNPKIYETLQQEMKWWINILRSNDLHNIVNYLDNEARIFGLERRLSRKDIVRLGLEANERIQNALNNIDPSEAISGKLSLKERPWEFIEFIRYSAQLQALVNIHYIESH